MTDDKAPEQSAYRRAALMWMITTVLVVWVAERHFSQLTADLLGWIPFAMFLRCGWKYLKAGGKLI
jgi:hypothetical protein